MAIKIQIDRLLLEFSNLSSLTVVTYLREIHFLANFSHIEIKNMLVKKYIVRRMCFSHINRISNLLRSILSINDGIALYTNVQKKVKQKVSPWGNQSWHLW